MILHGLRLYSWNYIILFSLEVMFNSVTKFAVFMEIQIKKASFPWFLQSITAFKNISIPLSI